MLLLDMLDVYPPCGPCAHPMSGRHPDMQHLESLLSGRADGVTLCGHAEVRPDIRVTDMVSGGCLPSIYAAEVSSAR